MINRTNQYHQPNITYDTYALLANTKKRVIFLGSPAEADAMKYVIPQLEYIATKNILESAEIIQAASVFIGNQSLPYALSEALKVPRILEVYLGAPNCTPHGKNGIDCYSAQEFEIWLKRAAEQNFRKYLV